MRQLLDCDSLNSTASWRVRGCCAIHKDADTGLFDQDEDIEPFVAMGTIRAASVPIQARAVTRHLVIYLLVTERDHRVRPDGATGGQPTRQY